ncbi:MAG: heparinase, partial [Bacteroidetes bacterium]|nr:heparinase [Bacteroidota bacterium]
MYSSLQLHYLRFRCRALCYLLVALSLICLSHTSLAGTGAEILTGNLTLDQIHKHLLPAPQWRPFPQSMNRAPWAALPIEVQNGYIREAEKHLRGEWPTPKATDFLGFVRTGNRSEYQAISYGRREQLATLVIAECVEGKGRFRDDIVNGIWTICEESYWGVPAHVGMQRKGSGLPDVSEPTVDLFAAETGSLLAWTAYLLKDSLDAVSPLVCERIYHEVDRRINTPNLDRNDFWWMGLTPKKVNNWTPWICSNWLATALILERDPDRRARAVLKILECLDRFLAEYTDDGGCDEGPSYWGRAGGSLFDCLEILHSATQGNLNWYAHPRIIEIGRFITRAHINESWFVNFADAPAKLRADAPTVYRFGKSIGDAPMMAFGSWLAREQHVSDRPLPGQFGVLGRVLPGLFVLDEVMSAPAAQPHFRDSWFPGIQVLMAR